MSYKSDRELYMTAYHIVDIGASNPKGVLHTYLELREIGYSPSHPAMRAICAHLMFLLGQGLGPEIEDLKHVIREYDRLNVLNQGRT